MLSEVTRGIIKRQALKLPFWSAFFSVLILDQISKAWVRWTFKLGEVKPILGDLLALTHWENPGAAFGLLPGAIHFFIITSVISILGSVFIYHRYEPYGSLRGIALGLISGGALGNLIDRLVKGKVTDFISFRYFAPVFNVADSAIVTGAFLFGFLLLFSKKNELKSEELSDMGKKP